MERALFRTFLILTVLALAGAGVAAIAGHRPAFFFAVLVLALAKARLVVLDFMEMRHNTGPLAVAMLGWAGLLLALAFARSLILSAGG